MDSHPELPARLARDLDGAFEDLVLVHQRLVFGLALRVVGDRAGAEEVAQDTFARGYHPPVRASAPAGPGPPSTWPAPGCGGARRRPGRWRTATAGPWPWPPRPRPSRPRWPNAARSGSAGPSCWPPCPAGTARGGWWAASG